MKNNNKKNDNKNVNTRLYSHHFWSIFKVLDLEEHQKSFVENQGCLWVINLNSKDSFWNTLIKILSFLLLLVVGQVKAVIIQQEDKENARSEFCSFKLHDHCIKLLFDWPSDSQLIYQYWLAQKDVQYLEHHLLKIIFLNGQYVCTCIGFKLMIN